MPFQYRDTTDPRLAGSISELMLRRGDIAAQQAQQVAQAQARAAETSGNAWAGATAGLGNMTARTILDATDPRRKLDAIQVEQAQQGQTDLKSLDAAYAQPGGRDAILSALPGHLRPKVAASFQAADKAAADAQEASLKAAALQTDYAGVLAVGVKEHGYDPAAAQLAISHAKATFANNPTMLQQLGQMEQAIHANPTPEVVRSLVDPMIAQSPKQTELANASKTAAAREQTAATGASKLQIEQPKIALETQKLGQEVAGTVPMTAAQQAQQARDTERLGLEKQRVGLEGARLGLERDKAAQGQSDKTDLTPEGLDAAAMMFAKTGQLPALGMGDKTTRKAIINRAAVMVPGLDVASAKADFGANSDSLKALQKQRDAIGAFEQTASKNIDVFLNAAGKIVDTGSPLANTLVRQASGKLLGSPDQAAYDAARQVAINEIAKITSNPTLSGTLSDSARHEVDAFNPQNATLKQTVAVMRLLKNDMQNRTGSLDEQIKAIQGRIGKATQPEPLKPTGRFNPATGKVEPF